MKNKKIFLYFRYKENKMQGLNSNFVGRPYCKKKETSQAGHQEADTQTNVQGKPMKNMIRKNIARKIQQ
jgi:hypothetical protein